MLVIAESHAAQGRLLSIRAPALVIGEGITTRTWTRVRRPNRGARHPYHPQ
jgi:hypothetical protein